MMLANFNPDGDLKILEVFLYAIAGFVFLVVVVIATLFLWGIAAAVRRIRVQERETESEISQFNP